MKGRRHTPEQIVRKLREADRLPLRAATWTGSAGTWLGDTVLLGVAASFFGAINAWLNHMPRMNVCNGLRPCRSKSLARAPRRTNYELESYF